jgi:hypothetical protein
MHISYPRMHRGSTCVHMSQPRSTVDTYFCAITIEMELMYVRCRAHGRKVHDDIGHASICGVRPTKVLLG